MEEKLLMRRANVILEISSDDKERFMEMGYSVIGSDGSILEEALPNDINSLRTMVRELQAQLAAKDKELEKLKKAPKK